MRSATLAIIALSDWADGGRFEALQAAMADSKVTREMVDEMLLDPQLHFGLLVRFGLAGALSVPFWYAPALVHWDGQGVGQSLFSSTLAVWRARGAFAIYLLGVGRRHRTVRHPRAGRVLDARHAADGGRRSAARRADVLHGVLRSLYFSFADSFELEERSPA